MSENDELDGRLRAFANGILASTDPILASEIWASGHAKVSRRHTVGFAILVDLLLGTAVGFQLVVGGDDSTRARPTIRAGRNHVAR